MKIFVASGVLIPITYIFMYLLGGALRSGYNHISDSVSELLSPGAPNRPVLIVIQVVYALLHILFGIGVLQFVQQSEGNAPIGRSGAWMIVALGIATFGTVIFPQDAKGRPATLSGKLHKVLVFGALIPFSILSTLLIGLWLRRAGIFPGFDVYSFITVGTIIVVGGIGGATVETQFAGLVERTAAIVSQQWLCMLALYIILA